MEPVKNLIAFIIIALITFGSVTFAQAQSVRLDLFYDEGAQALRLDRFVESPVTLTEERDIITADDRFEDRAEDKIEVTPVSSQGRFSRPFKYETQTGAFQIIVPYYEHVTELILTHPENRQQELSVDIVQLAVCNQNTICEGERGETSQNCLVDCPVEVRDLESLGSTTVEGIIPNDVMSTDGDSEVAANTTGSSGVPIRLIIGLVMIGGVGVYIGYKVFRKLKK